MDVISSLVKHFWEKKLWELIISQGVVLELLQQSGAENKQNTQCYSYYFSFLCNTAYDIQESCAYQKRWLSIQPSFVGIQC